MAPPTQLSDPNQTIDLQQQVARLQALLEATRQVHSTIREEEVLRSIWKDAEELMPAAMIDRRIVTTLPKHRPHKSGKVLKEEAHYVYRRNGLPCFVCGTIVKKQEVAGRNLFWCPRCQAE